MALFGSNWLEDDRLPDCGCGSRAKMHLYEDNWHEDITKEIRDFFNIDVESEEYKRVANKVQQVMLSNLRPKMTWVQKSTPYAPAARWYCSNCGNDEMYKTPFCPICGAMEVKDD